MRRLVVMVLLCACSKPASKGGLIVGGFLVGATVLVASVPESSHPRSKGSIELDLSGAGQVFMGITAAAILIPSVIGLMRTDEAEIPVVQQPPVQPPVQEPLALYCVTSATSCFCASHALVCEQRRSEVAARELPSPCASSERDLCEAGKARRP